MKRFVLIDGNAILHRAYHALPPFTTSQGVPVGAVYGFVAMLLKIMTDLKPSHLAVAFDMEKPTFRKTLYVGYQSQRPKMESDLSPQFKVVRTVLDAMNIPVFGVEGYEADDVIGTIAYTINEKNTDMEVVIVTGDRDILQLVNSHTKVYMPIKGLSEAKMYGVDEVIEKFGLKPEQVVDMKALTGDASDNYPGVAGIGPKTASTLLQKYKTLEAVYEHLEELKDRPRELLAQGAESAGLAQKLATIVKDVPLQFDVELCVFHIKDQEKAVAVLREFEFKTLPNRLLEILGGKPTEIKEASTLQITKKAPDQLRLV